MLQIPTQKKEIACLDSIGRKKHVLPSRRAHLQKLLFLTAKVAKCERFKKWRILYLEIHVIAQEMRKL